jgi:hypothetical protein
MTFRDLTTKIIAIPLIAGAILGGCSSDKTYNYPNQTLQGWHRGQREPDSPTVLVFDSLPPEKRTERDAQHEFVYKGYPVSDSLKIGTKYNLVTDDSTRYSNIVSIEKSQPGTGE